VSQIHPTSVVSPQAELDQDIEIGPFCVIEDGVRIGRNCRLEAHVVLRTGVQLGSENYLAEGVVLGGLPQHKRAHEAPGQLIIGDGNTLREHVTVHRGLTSADVTRLGDNNLLMVGTHVAHDCHLGNDTILANNVMLAGHVSVGDRAFLSGAVGVHQFCRVGAYAMVGGQAHIVKDVPPFVTVDGVTSMIVGLNLVGMKRAGFSATEILSLKSAYRVAFRSGLRWEETLTALREQFPTGCAAELHRFMAETKRGCIQERATPRKATLRLHLPSDDNSGGGSSSEEPRRRSA